MTNRQLYRAIQSGKLSLKAPKVPSDFALLDSADPMSLTFADLAKVQAAKARATECATDIDGLGPTLLTPIV